MMVSCGWFVISPHLADEGKPEPLLSSVGCLDEAFSTQSQWDVWEQERVSEAGIKCDLQRYLFSFGFLHLSMVWWFCTDALER